MEEKIVETVVSFIKEHKRTKGFYPLSLRIAEALAGLCSLSGLTDSLGEFEIRALAEDIRQSKAVTSWEDAVMAGIEAAKDLSRS